MFTSVSRRCHFHRRQSLRHSLSSVTAFHLLTSASPAVASIQSLTLPSCHRCQLLSRFVVPSLACHSLTSASHTQCRLVVVLRVPQESYKSGYWPARYVTNFLLCTAQSCDTPLKKIGATTLLSHTTTE